MGMFSYIKCNKELPLNEELKNLSVKWNEVEFQTKDLDNCLETYIISDDGSLLEEEIEYEYTYYTEEEKKLNKSIRPWDMVKDQKIIKKETKKLDFHGKITFYESFNLNENESVWVDFVAYFIYGKLDKIEIAKIEKYENRDVKMEEFWKKQDAIRNSVVYKIKRYSGWFWFWKKLGIICYKISGFFASINYFIIKNIR